jgi:hypothetical protein
MGAMAQLPGADQASAPPAEKAQAAEEIRTDATAKITPASADATAEAASRIILAKIEVREATLRECANLLRKKAAELSNDPQPINMMVNVSDDAHVPLITLLVTDHSLLDVAKQIAAAARVDFSTEPHVLVFGAAPPKVILSAPSAAWNKAQELVFKQIELRNATITETLAFFRKKSQEVDPEGLGVELILKPGTVNDAQLTLSLREMPLSENLRHVAGLAGLELVAEPGALVLQPPTRGELQRLQKER